ncbi:FG-GAP-like repeat-containing protein [Salinibacter ruber]|uniref:FG-GAP-like repeat-containing protein n=1 Tax=Salinibacter ruber TaxID=146919 RepID=UPI0021674843
MARATDTVSVALSSVDVEPMDEDTLTVFGSRFGRHEGTIEVTSDSIRFISDCPFRPGETVTVTVDEEVSSDLGNPYVWQFTVRSEYGEGTFSPETSVSFGQQSQEKQVAKLGSVEIPSDPFAADFNRPLSDDSDREDDLQTDVAFVNQEAEEVQILYGPDLSQSNLDISVPGATTLSGGDLNNDGLPDLVVVSSFSDNLTILLNDEDGTFKKGPQISTGARPTDVVIADLNGNGNQDLAVAPFGEKEVEVYINKDSDNNIAFQSVESYSVGAAPTTLTARDVDRDGALDLLVGSSGEERIDVLGNDGQGRFPQNGSLRASVNLGFVPASISANDVIDVMGNDGSVDLIVSGQGEGEMVLVENNPANPFGFSTRDSTALPSTPDGPALGLALADVDAGEKEIYDLDLLSTYRSSDSLQVLPISSNNGYGMPSSFSSESSDPVGVVDLDVDRDGDQDFAVINPRGTALDLFTNQGGRPSPPVTLDSNDSRTIDFAGICVGNSSTETVQIKNISPNRVVIDSSAVPDGFTVTSSLPVTLRPRETRMVNVRFEPESIRDYGGAEFLVANELTKSCGRETKPKELPIEVSGTGLGISISEDGGPVEFGEVLEGNSSTESFTIQNNGNDDADIQDIQGLDGTPFEIVDSPSSVPGGGQEQVTVRFAPTEPNASYEETVRVTLESRSCDQQETVEVTLTGSSRPPRPDLVAEEVFVDGGAPSPVRVSDTLSVQCVYSNQGGTRVDNPFDWEIRKDGEPEGSETDSGLAVGDSRETSAVEVQFPDEGPTEITCEVDSEDLITEQAEDNNTATLNLTVELPEQLPVRPNPFTPNGDGVNEAVKFDTREFGLNQPTVEIYTFEGRLIRSLSDVSSGKIEWDGTDDSGEKQPPGVYLYVVRDEGQDVASGQVTLAR